MILDLFLSAISVPMSIGTRALFDLGATRLPRAEGGRIDAHRIKLRFAQPRRGGAIPAQGIALGKQSRTVLKP